jgi:hypothetical protein
MLEDKEDRMPICNPVISFEYGQGNYAKLPCISHDGRTLALPSHYGTYFVDPSTMEIIA